MRNVALAIATLAIATSAHAATSRDKLLTTQTWLASHLNDKNLVILHAGDKTEFDAGHIPGAQLVGQDGLATTGPGGLVLEMPSAEELRKQMQDLGISNNSRIVIYAGRGGVQSATRLIFTFDAAGLGSNVTLLDGGLTEWKRAGAPLTDKPTPARVSKLAPLKMKPLVVDADFVRAHASAKGYKVIDARAAVFYDGVQAGMGGAQKGHIPGASSIPFTTVTGTDAKLKSAEQLRSTFTAAGVKPGDKVVVYCHVGQQATAVIYAARTLGIDAVLYDGAFQDWSQRKMPVEAPAATAATAATAAAK